jgi:NADPH2:quinone reductase
MVRDIFQPDGVVDYVNDDVAEAAREFTNGRGCQLAIDGNGPPSFEKSLATLAIGGKLLLYGSPGKGRISTPTYDINMRSLTIRGFNVFDDQYPTTRAAFEREVIPRVADGRFKIHIAERYPLPEAFRAHQALEAHRHVGKVVLVA